MNTLQAWLTLHLTPHLGALGCKRLADFFGGPLAVLQAKPADLAKVKGVKKDAMAAIAAGSSIAAMEKELAEAERLGIRIICLDDSEYPPLLRDIYDPPVILYLHGRCDFLDKPGVAIVGSRAATAYGLKIARQMASDLTGRGVMVVSGMAMGIDTAAHLGSLEQGGPTLAVLGCGVDVVYPRHNLKLYNEIVEKGLVLSEYPLGTKPEGFRFPARNRIISGMAMGVLVVEAAKKSGSLITARMALDEGREVFAIPGRIDSFKSAGTHHLLQEGAKLVNSVDDILVELPLDTSLPSGLPAVVGRRAGGGQDTPGPDESALLALLDVYPQSMDQLILQSGLSVARINEMMLFLEIAGLVEVQPGQQFCLTKSGRDSSHTR